MTKKSGDHDDPPLIQWLVAGTGFVLFLACVAALAWEAATAGDSPPDLRASVETVVEQRGGWLARIDVRNSGGETAANVVVQGELMAGDSAVETSEFTLDYVPRMSRRSGGLFFTRDPRTLRLELRALGYREP